MMIVQHGFFIPEVKNEATSRLLHASFAISNIATSLSLIQNYGVIYKGKHNIRTSPRKFSSNSTNIHANSKIPSIEQS